MTPAAQAHRATGTATISTPMAEQLRSRLRRELKAVLAHSFDRFIPAQLTDTFQPITSLTSLVTRRREHVAALRLQQALIGVILDGRKEIHLAGQVWHLVAGDCLFLPAGIEMDAVNEPDQESGIYRAIVLNLPADLILRTATAYPSAIGKAGAAGFAGTPKLAVTPAAIDSLVHAVQQISTASPNRQETLVDRLIEHRVMEVMLHFAERTLVSQTTLPDLSDRVRFYLQSQPARAWTARDLATELHMSEATLRRRLAREGHGFKPLLDACRMDLAKRLLTDRSLSIDSVALSCGYATRAKFEQRFCKLHGVTPQAFRQCHAT